MYCGNIDSKFISELCVNNLILRFSTARQYIIHCECMYMYKLWCRVQFDQVWLPCVCKYKIKMYSWWHNYMSQLAYKICEMSL